MGTTQTTYAERIDAHRAGIIQGSDYDTISRSVETVAGIGFGLAVAQGTNDKGCILGGTTTTFLGATVRDITLEGDQDDTIDQYQEASVMRRGSMAVSPSGDVLAGGAVYFTAATGRFSSTSGGNVLVKGARWETTALADGFAVLYLSGLQRGVDA